MRLLISYQRLAVLSIPDNQISRSLFIIERENSLNNFAMDEILRYEYYKANNKCYHTMFTIPLIY